MMINCSSSRYSTVLLEHGYIPTRWNMYTTFAQFLVDAFPQKIHPGIEDIKEIPRGTKLKKHARLQFQGTDDIANHLKPDRKAAIVEIFDHTAVLKEQLRLTRDMQLENISMPELVKLGVLPRELALEVLDSIQKLLFPLVDSESHKLLESLTSSSTSNFDKDVLH